ncbi:MAG: hypothetical protein KDB04_15500, partial [Acidimicrobiales bacterium]|nr:hypothetical protein [Acidimicrobiales bacterium]
GVLDALLERAGASSCVSWSIDGDRVLVLRLAELDPGDAIAPRARWIAAGAALERVLVEARRSGLWLRERLRLDSEDDGLVATLERVDEPRARSGSPWPLVGSRGLNDDLVDALERTARAAGGHLRVILRGARHEAMARALAEAERLALLTPGLSARARDDYEGSGGGARLATALLRDPEARALVRAIDGGRTLVCASLRALSESDGVALLSVPDATRASLVAGGRARARLRMFLETCSIRARPMGAALHVLTVDPARELTPRERATVQELRERLDALLDGGFTDGVPVALLRLADDDRGAPR